MLEELSTFSTTEAGKVIIPALIGAITAIIIIVIKDIILYELREHKRRKNELLDRKLSQVYGPLYMSRYLETTTNLKIYTNLLP